MLRSCGQAAAPTPSGCSSQVGLHCVKPDTTEAVCPLQVGLCRLSPTCRLSCASPCGTIPERASLPRLAQASLSPALRPHLLPALHDVRPSLDAHRSRASLRSTMYDHPWTQKTRRKAGSLLDIYLRDYMYRRNPRNRLVVSLSPVKLVALARMANFLLRS